MKAHKLSPVKIPLSRLNQSQLSSPGMFILYRTNLGNPAYVGRADYSLYNELKNWAKNPGTYRYYRYMKCSNADDAYQWHCMFWHHGQKTIDNSEAKGGAHPRPPVGSSVKCPFPGCTFDEEREAEAAARAAEKAARAEAAAEEALELEG